MYNLDKDSLKVEELKVSEDLELKIFPTPPRNSIIPPVRTLAIPSMPNIEERKQ